MPLTISAATPHKRAQLSPEDRKDRQEARADKQALIDSAVTEWFNNTMALAEELATRHKLKPQYFLNLFFQGGARMIHQQKKAEKSAECRERGESKKVPELHEEYFDDKTLSDRYTESHGSRTLKLRRNTPRAKIQYVSNIIRNMKLLMVGLASHVGAEGFFCVVRNSSDFHMDPQWYFTS
ncbi:hypothetical protein B0H14DRAFT_2987477, partial [Mycena olivaceomarginata]